MTFEVPRKDFEMSLMPNTGSSMILVGCSKSGKTTLMKHIYKSYYAKHLPLMFTMNAHAAIYKDMGPRVICFDEYRPNVLKAAHAINSSHDNKFRFLVITDDIVGAKVKNDDQITKLLTVYRNAGIDTIMSMQDLKLLNPIGRNNANYMCVFKQQSPKRWMDVVEELLIHWFPLKADKFEIVKFCIDATKDHSFFFIDNLNNTICLCKLRADQI